jgi:hypothetical protein
LRPTLVENRARRTACPIGRSSHGRWRRTELKAGSYDEIVSGRLDHQLSALETVFEFIATR